MARLWRFHGGLKLNSNTADSTANPVTQPPLPPKLVLPLHQHIGTASATLVSPGDMVTKGEVIARAEGYVSVPLHAPTSGRVVAVGACPVAHPSGLSAECIVLKPDGEDRWCEQLVARNPDALEPPELRSLVREAGLVGLGGAAFPSAVKLNPDTGRVPDLLVINGAECEPYVSCDDMLMRERPKAVVAGARILARALGVQRCLIGIEDNKPSALRSMIEALAMYPYPGMEVRALPTIYPSGGEKQLIQVLTNLEVPSDTIPSDIGIVCHNVGTAAAAHDAVLLGRPLISRYLTVTGLGVATPRTLEVLIGTLVKTLVEACGGYTEKAARLVIGGPMMGFAARHDDIPVVKGSNCILVAGDAELSAAARDLPCIRCGDCADVCPANLLPQQLYWFARAHDFDAAQDFHLFDCIECGCCATVCPSRIPLVQHYRAAKTEIWAMEREREKADSARQRHEHRQLRLEREQRLRSERIREKRAMLGHDGDGNTGKKLAIKAALARARVKRMELESSADPDRQQEKPNSVDPLDGPR